MVTGCGCVLFQHLPLVTASVICEVSVPSPGWGQGATRELDAFSFCLYRRGFRQQIVCLVLKAIPSRTLVLLGLMYQTGSGSSELPLGVFCIGGLWDLNPICIDWEVWSGT